MTRIGAWALAAGMATAAAAAEPQLSAAQILEKHAEARGGAEAWRRIETMVWIGRVETVNAAKLPFMLEQKRPNKTRFEVIADKQKSIRLFDGTSGWKLRLGAGARPELKPYGIEETSFARDPQGMEGPLVDYAAKRIAVSLAGVDELDGRKAYRFDVRLPSGMRQRAWVDAETFLDVKWERGAVQVRYRDYHAFEGLQIPVTVETVNAAGTLTDRLTIEKVALNPELPDRHFAKPALPGARRNAVAVDTRIPPQPR
jgi:outer membrane lipoprotein-sorting protein